MGLEIDVFVWFPKGVSFLSTQALAPCSYGLYLPRMFFLSFGPEFFFFLHRRHRIIASTSTSVSNSIIENWRKNLAGKRKKNFASFVEKRERTKKKQPSFFFNSFFGFISL
jgi:hypothetical protein